MLLMMLLVDRTIVDYGVGDGLWRLLGGVDVATTVASSPKITARKTLGQTVVSAVVFLSTVLRTYLRQ